MPASEESAKHVQEVTMTTDEEYDHGFEKGLQVFCEHPLSGACFEGTIIQIEEKNHILLVQPKWGCGDYKRVSFDYARLL
jgi:hypothetical protein